MKKIYFALLVAQLCGAWACQSGANQGNTAEKLELSPAEFEEKIATLPNEQLVDVRTAQEVAEGKIKEAMHIDYNGASFQQTALQQLDKAKPVLVYCYSGGRSGEAANFLRANGYQVYELEGGIQKWKQADKPLETAPMTTTATADAALAEGVISLAEFNRKVAGNKPVLVDFSAVWCAPCKRMKPTIDQIAQEMADKVEVIMVDVDKSEEVAAAYKIEAMPTLLLFKKSKVVWEKVGETQGEEIKGAINAL